MNPGYSDIFFDWLLKELQDEKNFTLLSDKFCLKHRHFDINIKSFGGEFMSLTLDGVNISDEMPEDWENKAVRLYSKIRLYYLDSYGKTEQIRRETTLNKFVVNNLMNY